MGFDNNVRSTNLSLCLGSDDMRQTKNIKTAQRFDHKYSLSFPISLTLGLSTLVDGHEHEHETACSSILSSSAVLSFSNAATSVKRERQEVSSSHEVFDLKQLVGSEEDIPYPTRKKLRLTKDQSLVLEDSFKDHDTLTPKEKQGLANMLNLRPRQVEVWFQNRRARTKLKQTEIETEILKKRCESLKEENRRLHKELQDLKALKLAPFYMQLPVATALNICTSCQRISSTGAAAAAAGENPSNISFFMGGTGRTQFYNTFANPYADELNSYTA